ncbi:hypothetical protein KM043_015192 [Ampulex compressa]|nr:hypothetical protein KM043_015192 [Ampulex compressa]
MSTMYSINNESGNLKNGSANGSKDDQNCQAIDKNTGEPCGEIKGFQVLSEFQKLYEDRIGKVDLEFEGELDRVSIKLQLMTKWVKDLEEQNVMLVQTVEDMEQAACSSVRLLEEKLMQSSKMMTENLSRSSEAEETLNFLSGRISILEKDEECLQQKVEFLQSDIRSLLELIRRARQENCWNIKGITFFEIQPQDIPVPVDCNCPPTNANDHTDIEVIQDLKLQIEQLKINETKALAYQKDLENKLADMTVELTAKEETIQKYVSKLEAFDSNLNKHSELTSQYTSSIDHIKSNQAHTSNILLGDNEISCPRSKDEVTVHMSNIKVLMEKEQEALCNLKTELNKFFVIPQQHGKEMYSHEISNVYKKLKDIEMLLRNFATQMNYHPESTETLAKYIAAVEAQLTLVYYTFQNIATGFSPSSGNICTSNITIHLDKSIENILRIHSEKERAIASIESIVMKKLNSYACSDPENSTVNLKLIEQLKLMEEFRVCTVEAQAATEDIHEVINAVISSFASQHKRFVNLSEVTQKVQNHTSRTLEGITETMNNLQLQEIERMRNKERIAIGKMKLKDIKNEINFAQSQLSSCIDNMHKTIQTCNTLGYSEVYTCNDLLSIAVEEIEEILGNLQSLQIQECSLTTTLEELKTQLGTVEHLVKVLHKETDEVILENEITHTTYCEREKRLEKLEAEFDGVHTKMQDVLEILFSSNEQQSLDGNTFKHHISNQTVNEVLQVKDELRKIKKEYDDLKLCSLKQTAQIKFDERINQWKCCVNDLQAQIRLLQHEAKCKDEANSFLKNSIELIEKELHSAQVKTESCRRTHSIDSMELKKKIAELENTLKVQKEAEYNFRKNVNDSVAEHTEHNAEGILMRCRCNQFNHENIPNLFKPLQDTMQSAKNGLQDIESDLKRLICESPNHSCTCARSVMIFIDKLKEYEGKFDECSQEIEELKGTLNSKEQLLENMDKIIKIQKDSIVMTQAELQDLHHKLQEKIDAQNNTIAQYEKEKTELLKQNELQIQTIGHLQNAVVETKRCLDQMGHKTTNELIEKSNLIRTLTVCIDETQSQFSQCYAEAAEQDTLLDLQRDAISELQEKIRQAEYKKLSSVVFLNTMYCSILAIIQEQLQSHISDFEALKYKMSTLVQSKIRLENKYANVKKLWQEAEYKLQKLKNTAVDKVQAKTYETNSCQCNVEMQDKGCDSLTPIFDEPPGELTDSHVQECTPNLSCQCRLQSEIDILTRENEDIKKQLRKYQLDFDIIAKELQAEKESNIQQPLSDVQKFEDIQYSLRSENENLRANVEKCVKDNEMIKDDLIKTLQHTKEREMELKEWKRKWEEKSVEFDGVCKENAYKERIIKDQSETINALQEQIERNEQEAKNRILELNDKHEICSVLRNRLISFKGLLKERSAIMAKLQVDVEFLQNENSILKAQSNIIGNKATENIRHMEEKLEEVRSELCRMEDNYRRVTQDFGKSQERLIIAAKREVALQESLTNTEKDCCSKLINAEVETTRLGDQINNLTDELEVLGERFVAKEAELTEARDACKSYEHRLVIMQDNIEVEKRKAANAEEAYNRLAEQLQNCIEGNRFLTQQSKSFEWDNTTYAAELQEMLKLKEEWQEKDRSLACLSAELTKTTATTSQLRNESEYVISCVRVWMEEQRNLVSTLISKLKSKHEELIQLQFEKKALLITIRNLRRINHLLMQRSRRLHRCSKGTRSVCSRNCMIPTCVLSGPTYSRIHKKCPLGPIRTARRILVRGNPWWFPKMEYLTNELRKNNQWYDENLSSRMEGDTGLEESRDCGYQSSTSK